MKIAYFKTIKYSTFQVAVIWILLRNDEKLLIVIISHSKYFPYSDWLKAHA